MADNPKDSTGQAPAKGTNSSLYIVITVVGLLILAAAVLYFVQNKDDTVLVDADLLDDLENLNINAEQLQNITMINASALNETELKELRSEIEVLKSLILNK